MESKVVGKGCMRDWVGGQSFPLGLGNCGGREQILEDGREKILSRFLRKSCATSAAQRFIRLDSTLLLMTH